MENMTTLDERRRVHSIDERMRTALVALRRTGMVKGPDSDAARRRAADAYQAVEGERWGGRLDAIASGIEASGSDLTALEVEALEAEAELLVAGLDSVEGMAEPMKLRALALIVEMWAEERLRCKVLAALRVESMISDLPPVDGVLGQAADQVAAALIHYLPAATRSHYLPDDAPVS